MADNEIGVRIVGDASSAQAALSASGDAVRQAAGVMQQGLRDVQQVAKDAFAGLTTSAKDSAAAVEQTAARTGTALTKVRTGTGEVTQASGQMKFAMRDLSYQLSDISTMFAMGAPPMQIFASQSSQVIGALSLMTGEAKGVLGVLGGPWGMIITAAVTALAPFIGKLFETKSALRGVGDEADKAMAKLRQSLATSSAATDAATEATKKYARASADLGKAQQDLKNAIDQQKFTSQAGGGSVPGTVGFGLDTRIAAARERVEKAKKDIADAKNAFAEIEQMSRVAGIQKSNQVAYDTADDKVRAAQRAQAKEAREAARAQAKETRDAAREAKQADREETEFKIAEFDRQISAAQGFYLQQIDLAQKEAEFVKSKYGERSREYQAALRKIEDIQRQADRQSQQIEQDRARAQQQIALAEIDNAEAIAREKLNRQEITNQQMLAQQRQFEAQRYAIQRQALVAEQNNAGKNGEIARYAQLFAQIEVLDRQHQIRLTAIERQAVNARTQYARQAANSIASGWAGQLARMATLQQGFGTTVRGIWGGLVGMFEQAFARILQQWILTLIAKEAVSKSFHMKEVMQEAKKAAASAWNSTAKIPIVGPILAPIAAATAFAGVMAFSAKEGYDVPAMAGPGIDGKGGQVGVVHPREMVLPADLADQIRNGGMGGGVNVHLHGAVINGSRELKRWAEGNASQLSAAGKRYARMNGRG